MPQVMSTSNAMRELHVARRRARIWLVVTLTLVWLVRAVQRLRFAGRRGRGFAKATGMGAQAAVPQTGASAKHQVRLSVPQGQTARLEDAEAGHVRLEPHAPLESTSSTGEPMDTVPQAAVSRPAIGPRQMAALIRWHDRLGQLDVLKRLAEQPHWPVIDTGGTPHAPRPRRQRRGGPGHAA